VQYPDIISFSYSGEGTIGTTGNWTAGSNGSVITGSCRYESSGGNGYIVVADGTRISYSGIIYMPGDVQMIKQGSKVTVTEQREGQADNVMVVKVLRFHRGQFNARIWV